MTLSVTYNAARPRCKDDGDDALASIPIAGAVEKLVRAGPRNTMAHPVMGTRYFSYYVLGVVHTRARQIVPFGRYGFPACP